jgi:hypothetical protein
MTMDAGELFDPREILPPSLRDIVTISEVDRADFFISDLFRRKFGHPPPDFPRHLVALYRDAHGALHLIGYSHMMPLGDVYLSGGSCSDGEAIRRMHAHEREALQAAGGIWYWILKYAFRKYAGCCEAFFGHCGDRRALEVALAAGFQRTEHEHLIVNWHKPQPENMRRALTAKVHAFGTF